MKFVVIEMSISSKNYPVLTHCDLLPSADKNSDDDDDDNSNNWQLTIDNCCDDYPTLTPKLREENPRETGEIQRKIRGRQAGKCVALAFPKIKAKLMSRQHAMRQLQQLQRTCSKQQISKIERKIRKK